MSSDAWSQVEAVYETTLPPYKAVIRVGRSFLGYRPGRNSSAPEQLTNVQWYIEPLPGPAAEAAGLAFGARAYQEHSGAGSSQTHAYHVMGGYAYDVESAQRIALNALGVAVYAYENVK